MDVQFVERRTGVDEVTKTLYVAHAVENLDLDLCWLNQRLARDLRRTYRDVHLLGLTGAVASNV